MIFEIWKDEEWVELIDVSTCIGIYRGGEADNEIRFSYSDAEGSYTFIAMENADDAFEVQKIIHYCVAKAMKQGGLKANLYYRIEKDEDDIFDAKIVE